MRKLSKKIKQEAEQVSEASICLYRQFVNFLINVRLPKFRKPLILLKAALVIALLFANMPGFNSGGDANQNASAMTTFANPKIVYINNLRANFEEKLVTEVELYINGMVSESKLDPSHIVEKCLEYETDIIFVLAQALLESHFGTRGKAVETNSVWNVGTFDNGTILYRYPDPNESLEPYLKLLKEDYLINITHAGDTIQKEVHELIMDDRRYTNYRGARFASARGYENGMRKLMVRIDMETSINFYQDILSLSNEELTAYFIPKDESLDYENFQASAF